MPPEIARAAACLDTAACVSKAPPSQGLTSAEAGRRLATHGPNTMPDTSAHPWHSALEKFWAPVPWMLEAAIVLQCGLGKFVEAGVIAGLLVFNAALGALQTLTFVALVFGSQTTLYAIRQRRHMWGARPSLWLAMSSIVDILIACILAIGGIVMTPLSAAIVGGTLISALLFSIALVALKIPVFARLGIT